MDLSSQIRELKSLLRSINDVVMSKGLADDGTDVASDVMPSMRNKKDVINDLDDNFEVDKHGDDSYDDEVLGKNARNKDTTIEDDLMDSIMGGAKRKAKQDEPEVIQMGSRRFKKTRGL